LVIESVACSVCEAYRWSVADQNLLASHVAKLAAGHAEVVRRALLSLSFPPLPAPPRSPADAAIAQIERADRYHRDGWLFQLIAWIAAVQSARTSDVVRAPQPQPAQHGIDGLVVHLDVGRADVEGVTICEQKASEHPRRTIRSEVWPGFEVFERSERDNQLLAEVTALLQTQPLGRAVELAGAIHWGRARRYRASVTVEPGAETPTGVAHLFRGFDNSVPGNVARRKGEVLPIPSLRAWMDEFAAAVVQALRSERAP
jgi:hypothetical protein